MRRNAADRRADAPTASRAGSPLKITPGAAWTNSGSSGRRSPAESPPRRRARAACRACARCPARRPAASCASTPVGSPRSMPIEKTWRVRTPPPVPRISLWRFEARGRAPPPAGRRTCRPPSMIERPPTLTTGVRQHAEVGALGGALDLAVDQALAHQRATGTWWPARRVRWALVGSSVSECVSRR